jgi:hypothetical protein
MTTHPNPAPSPQVLALAADRGLGAHVTTQQLGHPVSAARLVACAVFTALCAAWIVFALVGGWGLLLLAMGLPFFLMTAIKMYGAVALYRNHREVHRFDGGLVVVARGRPTAFRWDTLTVTPNWLGNSLLDVRLTGTDGSEAVLVAGSFGDDALVRLTGVLQSSVSDRGTVEGR